MSEERQASRHHRRSPTEWCQRHHIPLIVPLLGVYCLLGALGFALAHLLANYFRGLPLLS